MAALLMGWYLVVPPPLNSSGVADTEPMSRWQRIRTYTSESECWIGKTELMRQLEVRRTSEEEHSERRLMALEHGQCISADDARLDGLRASKP
jgi:hypothetical protein